MASVLKCSGGSTGSSATTRANTSRVRAISTSARCASSSRICCSAGWRRVKVFRQHRDLRFSRDKRPYKERTYGVAGGLYVQISARGMYVGTGYYRVSPTSSRATGRRLPTTRRARYRVGPEEGAARRRRREPKDRTARLPARPRADRAAAPQAADRGEVAGPGDGGIAREPALEHGARAACARASAPIVPGSTSASGRRPPSRVREGLDVDAGRRLARAELPGAAVGGAQRAAAEGDLERRDRAVRAAVLAAGGVGVEPRDERRGADRDPQAADLDRAAVGVLVDARAAAEAAEADARAVEVQRAVGDPRRGERADLARGRARGRARRRARRRSRRRAARSSARRARRPSCGRPCPGQPSSSSLVPSSTRPRDRRVGQRALELGARQRRVVEPRVGEVAQRLGRRPKRAPRPRCGRALGAAARAAGPKWLSPMRSQSPARGSGSDCLTRAARARGVEQRAPQRAGRRAARALVDRVADPAPRGALAGSTARR